MKRMLLAFVVASAACGPVAAGEQPAPRAEPRKAASDCQCRAYGRMFDLGATACLKTPKGMRVAQCVMVLNNTSWSFSERACPES
jgi:hypothetical protein